MKNPADNPIIPLLNHLKIKSAHVAARIVVDYRALAQDEPGRIASLTLVAPNVVPVDALVDIQTRTTIISSDLPMFGDWAAEALRELPHAKHQLLEGYQTPLWADLTRDRGSEIRKVLLEQRDANPIPEVTNRIAAEGEVNDVTYRVLGSGPPLILFPLGLAPSAWEPLGVVVRGTDLPMILNIPLPPEERARFEQQVRRPEGESCATASLYRYFQESGLENVRFGPYLANFRNAGGIVEQFVYSGFVTQLEPEDRQPWEAAIQQADRDGTFLLGWPHHMAVGTKHGG